MLRLFKPNTILERRRRIRKANTADSERVIQRGKLAIIPYGIYMFKVSRNLITYLKVRLESEEVKPLLKVWLREEIYKGSQHVLERFPHIVYIPNEVRGVWVYSYKLGLKLWKFSKIADHSMYGVLIMYGDKLMEEQMVVETSTCTTFDVMPTILAYMKVPIPPYIDGRTLVQVKGKVKYRDYRSLWLLLKRVRMSLTQNML